MTMKPKTQTHTHTPGPWILGKKIGIAYYPGKIYAGDHIEIVEVPTGDAKSDANARLIAAAPDLLAAAKEVFDTLNDGPADRECPFTSRPKMVCDCVGHRMLRAAIAKAEGR